ncbi:MAG: class I SAM-dependent methyltransferase [Candidatus Bipolaricaulia bacterium]
MITWDEKDLKNLEPVLERIEGDLYPLEEKDLLVLCSGRGELTLRLAEKVGEEGMVVGAELDEKLIEAGRERAKSRGLEGSARFFKPRKDRLPFPDETFDNLVSEFIVHPTEQITKIGQPEMARVLKPGGSVHLTDVITTHDLSEDQKQALSGIGLDYICQASRQDFEGWMENAGFGQIEVEDLTPQLVVVWSERKNRKTDADSRGWKLLLEESPLKLGEGIHYIYIKGEITG